MKKQYFTVGPAQLFYTVEGHIKQALKDNIPSISHRGKAFTSIVEQTLGGIRSLLNIPASHHVVFTGSATEIWERLIQNTVQHESFHLVNGAFSEKFFNISEMLGKVAKKSEVEPGNCVEIDKILIPETTELIAITHNETSTGAMYEDEDINKLAKAFPDQIIAVDIVSSAPVVNIDWELVDTAYFSVQKAFGLPAGLGVWIFNEKCLEKSRKLLDKNVIIGSYHSIPELVKNIKKHQTPETPNVLGIYLLGKVVEDMLSVGFERIKRDTKYKAAVLYQALEKSPDLNAFIKNVPNRSTTTIVAESSKSDELRKKFEQNQIIISSGYGDFVSQHIRIANFPTHSNEQIEMLADFLAKGDIVN